MPQKASTGLKQTRENKNSEPEVDLEQYARKTQEHPPVADLSRLSVNEKERLLASGVDVSQKKRSGTFIQQDHSVIFSQSLHEGLEVMSITEALAKYDWLRDYSWKLVQPAKDKYTSLAHSTPHHGYFIRALPGAKISYPLQSCLYLGKEGLLQNVHNIVIAEEGSDLQIITGCTTASYVKKGAHIGISEFYVKKNAQISFTMIHNWSPEVVTRPRSNTVVEAGGTFLSNYICLKPAKSLQMNPGTYLLGAAARARYNSILVAAPGSHLDVGAQVFLKAPRTSAEIITRAVSTGGVIIARGHLVGEVPGVKAHLECRGLILAPNGKIHAIPELEGKGSELELSHEAAVGKIAKEEIEYLMARGLTATEAQATIVRGFLDTTILGLPAPLQKEIDKLVSASEEETL